MCCKMLPSLLFAVLLLAGCNNKTETANTSAAGAATLPTAGSDSAPDVEWQQHGLDAAETRFSALRDINSGNVSELGLKWYFDYPTNRGMEATPLIVDGVIYTTASWSMVFAHDARSGKLGWRPLVGNWRWRQPVPLVDSCP